MAPKFGTSGLRGLVSELTPDLVANHIRAFAAACPNGGAVFVGRDLRPSSPALAKVVLDTVVAEGLDAMDCGAVPTPALALAAMGQGAAAVMVTGSHIPADRNGLKFYVPSGEISKEDEAAIKARLGSRGPERKPGALSQAEVMAPYLARYTEAFGAAALAGLRIGVYQHSSVARDALGEVLAGLGAEVVALGRSESFVPVDTEAVDPKVAAEIFAWVRDHALDALVSTDGDADRPLVADGDGRLVPGDVLGPLTARHLAAEVVVTPVTSNGLVTEMADFVDLHRTRIGSPHVIAAMEDVLDRDEGAKVIGYEANGGFLLGFTAEGAEGEIAPLMTRDCLLPIIAPLVAAREAGRTLAGLVAELPPRFTAADRVVDIPAARSAAFIATLTADPRARAEFFDGMGEEVAIDTTDGLRVTFTQDRTVHLRPSGNAPECRCYAEAGSREAARDLVQTYLAKLAAHLQPD